MKTVLSILGPLLTGAIGLAVFAPNAVDAGMMFNQNEKIPIPN